jgi:hypothetical protein
MAGWVAIKYDIQFPLQVVMDTFMDETRNANGRVTVELSVGNVPAVR